MRVRVLFFGMLKDLTGGGSDTVELRNEATLGELLDHYEARFPALKNLLPCLAMSVNQQYAGPEVRLHANDEVALLPPVSAKPTLAPSTQPCNSVGCSDFS